MKKDIEWAKNRMKNTLKFEAENDREIGFKVAMEESLGLLNQIDEPELPVVPTWFDEWWKDVYKGEDNLFHNIGQFHDKLYSYGTREVYDYINDTGNKKKLLNIIINELDYKVEEEQKYFVSSRESVGFWFLSKNNDNEVVIGTNKDYYDRKWESLKLTEEEIKDYDSRYWAFAVKVEEVEE